MIRHNTRFFKTLVGALLWVACLTIVSFPSTSLGDDVKATKPDDGTGLVAHYYRDTRNWGGTWPDTGEVTGDPKKWTFSSYSYSRVEPLINHLFLRSGWFSVRWKGSLTISEKGNSDKAHGDLYTFFIWADDGCRLFIDGKPLIDSWQPTWEKSPEALRKATTRLKPGKHTIVVEYFQGSSLVKDDKDPIKLYWKCKALKIPKQIIPASHFSHADADFAVEGGKVEAIKESK